MLSPYFAEITDIPKLLRLNCFHDNLVNCSPVSVMIPVVIRNDLHTNIKKIHNTLTVLSPYLSKLIISE